jgi:outer membrane protein
VSGLVGSGRLDPQGFFGLGAANVSPRVGQIGLEQPLFTGGRTLAGLDQARAGIAGAEAGVALTRSTIVMQTAQAYGDVLALRDLRSQFLRLEVQMTEIERQAALRFAAGEVPSTDVSQAAARRAEADGGLARVTGHLRAAEARYANLTGLKPDDLTPLPANPALPESLEAALADAARDSPELTQVRAQRDAAAAGLRAAQGGRLPSVGLYVEATTIRDQFFPDYRADGTSVGVRARWDLFSGGRISGQVAEARAGLRAAEARLQAAENRTEEQVIAAWEQVQATLLVADAAAAQRRAAAEALESVRHEVRVGAKPQLALLDAEREALQATAGAVAAGTDRIVAAWRLRLLVGVAP